MRHDVWISFIIFFLVVYFLTNRFPEERNGILISFLLTIIGLEAVGCLVDGAPPLLGLPNILAALLACLLGSISGLLGRIRNRYLVFISGLALCLSYSFAGHRYLLNYLNFGTFTGKITSEISGTWTSKVSGPAIDIDKKKLLLLDFFNTSCPICFRKFPVLQSIKDKYKNDSDIGVYAINIPIARDTPGMAQQMIHSRNYTFPVLIGKNKLDSFFGIQSYPTTILLKNNIIIFKGDIDNVVAIIDKELNKN